MKKCYAILLCILMLLPHGAMATGGEPEETAVPVTEDATGETDAAATSFAPDGMQRETEETESLPDTAAIAATMSDLYQLWVQQGEDGFPGYPDYVCGVWSTDGTVEHLTVAVTKDEAGEAGKREILALIEDDSTVGFTYQSYAYEELAAVQREIGRWMVQYNQDGVIVITAVGIAEMENRVSVMLNSEASSKEEVCVRLFDEFGNRVMVEEGGIIVYDVGVESPALGDGSLISDTSGRLWIYMAVLMVAAAWAFFQLLRVRQSTAVRTTAGTVEHRALPLTDKQVEKLVKEDLATPSAALDQKILNRIEE